MEKGILKAVDFYGDKVWLVAYNGEPYVPVRPIAENLGLHWSGQQRKLLQDVKRWQIQTVKVEAQDGKLREMLCLPLRKLPAWLMSISPSRVKPEIREKLVRYQEECDRVLWEYWMRSKSVPARVEEDEDELYREADRVLRELQAIRRLEEEGLEEDEARLELCRRAILGGRAVAMLRDLRLGQSEISALFLAKMAGRTVEDAARIAGVTGKEAEEAYRAFELLGRDPWEVLNAVEAFKVPLPWEEEPGIRVAARTIENAIRRLCARAGNPEILSSVAPGWLRVRKDRVYILGEVVKEIGLSGGDVWVLADLLGWRRGYCGVKLSGKKTDVRAVWLPVREFRSRYFEGERPAEVEGPEPVRRMADWLVKYWEGADERHRAWLEKQFIKAFPDFAAEERD